MNDSIYQAPQVELLDTERPVYKASRLRRLFANLIDTFCMSVIVLPAMYFGGLLELATSASLSWSYTLQSGTLWALVFLLFNGLLLVQRGQTIGKLVLSIKIVMQDHSALTVPTLAIRYGVYFLGNLIPLIGPLFGLINVLFIFGEERRCLHDRAAKTIVVNV
ncbi:MAG TPA: RDD family protein [Cellvibrionaceae bacterium]|nr:RDD family protein [Cellvibrionaceae bacterium]HMW48585.1 RDD family protein [Cellvibrionaceae bacterium]HMY39215.1 RDD family protein [Marinagarivorans sp.]HNG59173.1 RDD family protein [Cellvibrionaceae bacterium]